MSVNASALRKGVPPPRAATKSPIDADRRPAEGKKQAAAVDGAAGRVRGLQRESGAAVRIHERREVAPVPGDVGRIW